MSEPRSPWRSLAGLPVADRRAKIDDQALARHVKEFASSTRQAVQEMRELLYLRGLLASDAYFEAAKENLYTENETAITPRIRWDEKSGTATFYWERTVKHIYPLAPSAAIHPNKGKGKSYKAVFKIGKGANARKVTRKVVLLSEHVRLSQRTDSIAPSTFQKEPLWSRTLGPLTEEKLTVLRKQSKLLTQINRCLNRLLQLEDEAEAGK